MNEKKALVCSYYERHWNGPKRLLSSRKNPKDHFPKILVSWLFNRTVIKELLWREFADVIKILNPLTLKYRDYPHRPDLITHKSLKAQNFLRLVADEGGRKFQSRGSKRLLLVGRRGESHEKKWVESKTREWSLANSYKSNRTITYNSIELNFARDLNKLRASG